VILRLIRPPCVYVPLGDALDEHSESGILVISKDLSMSSAKTTVMGVFLLAFKSMLISFVEVISKDV